jgi:hypothetical protein
MNALFSLKEFAQGRGKLFEGKLLGAPTMQIADGLLQELGISMSGLCVKGSYWWCHVDSVLEHGTGARHCGV